MLIKFMSKKITITVLRSIWHSIKVWIAVALRLITQLYLKVLNVLNYPCGYMANNKLLICSILISALGAYL
jgi:hypothetical protein